MLVATPTVPPTAKRGGVLLVSALSFNALLLATTAFYLWRSHDLRIEAAWRGADNVAHLTMQDIENDYRAIDLALRSLVDELTGPHPPTNDAQVEEWLDHVADMHPIFEVLGITDAQGKLTHGTRRMRTRDFRVDDRPYFATLRDNPDAGLQVSAPLQGRGTGKNVLVFARRLAAPGGSFQGIVVASYPIAQIGGKISELRLEAHDTVDFISPDQQRTRVFPPPTANQAESFGLLAALSTTASNGRFADVDRLSGDHRYYSFRRSQAFGFVVGVGISGEAAVAAWREELLIAAWMLPAVLSVTLLLALYLSRAWQHIDRALVELRDANTRLDEAQKLAKAGYFSLDLESGDWQVSDHLAGILGIDRDHPRDKAGWRALLHPDDASRVQRLLDDEVAARGRDYDAVFRIIRPDGGLRWVHGRGRLERAAPGKRSRLFGSLQDITESELGRQALRESSALLQAAGEVARIGGWSLAVPEMKLTWSDETYVLHAVPPGEAITLEQGIAYCAPAWQPVIAAALKAAVEDGAPFDLEPEIIARDGRRFWARVIGRAETAFGKTRRVFGAFIDIDEIRRTQERIRQSEQRFQSFFQSALVGMAVTTPDKGTQLVNPALCAMLGHTEDELKRRSWVDLTHPDDLAADLARYHRMLGGEIEHYTLEKRFIRADGEIRHALITVHGVKNSQGDIDFVASTVQDITTRVHAERQLAEAAATLERILETSVDGYWKLAPDGRLLDVNPAYCAYSGYRREELLGMSVADLEVGESPAEIQRQVGVVLHREKDLFETRHRRKDGTIWQVEVSAARGLRGETHVFLRDITERKSLEEKVLNSREQLRQFLDHLPASAYLKDENSTVLIANMGFKTLFGLDPIAMIGKRSDEIFTGELGEKIVADDRRIVASGNTEVLEEIFGGRYYESTKFVIRTAGRSLLGGITIDVTQRAKNRMRAEALLALTARRGTGEERELLRFGLAKAEVLTASAIGFLLLVGDDQQTVDLLAGAAAGQNGDAITRCPVDQLGIWTVCFHQQRALAVNDRQALTALPASPRLATAPARLIAVPVIEDGKVRMMMSVGDKDADYDAFDIESVQLIADDLWRMVRRERAEAALKGRLAEITELNRKLTQAQGQLLQSEKMSAIGQLAAGVAHEINNPLGFIQSNLGTLRGYADDLLMLIERCEACADACPDPAPRAAFRQTQKDIDLDFLRGDVRQLIAESLDGAERARRIVQNLKDFSHVSEDEWQWADLHAGLDSTLNLVWNEIKYKAEVEKIYGPLPPVYCVASQINQVFMNLLVNAAQAIESNGKITLRSGVEGAPDAPPERVWIEVRDTGKGIPPENLPHIFEPFFTTKPVGQGTGLGLSLAWSIVEKHRGSLGVQSSVGHGTTFRLILPIHFPEKERAT